MTPNRLLATAIVVLLLTWVLRAAPYPAESFPALSPHPAIVATASDPSSDYVGSRACASCHQDAYAQWERSLHIRMTKPVAEATVLGDFSGAVRLAAHGRQVEFGRRKGRPFMKIAFGAAAPETFEIDYTLGFKRFQGYLSTLPDGRMYVLPAFWHVESKRWIDWKEITPIPDNAHGLRQIWNVNCFNCHATNLVQGFDTKAKTYKTTWTEMGVGCEACHGPGRRHIASMEEWRKDPTYKPGGTLDIFSTSNATPRQAFDACAYCHGNKRNVFAGFKAGARYEDYALPFLISAPIPEHDLQGEFWPDGRPNRFNRPQALMVSGCFKAGEAVCTSCHVAHGSDHPFSLKVDITKGRNGDALCTQCHLALATPRGGAASSRVLAVAPGEALPDELIERHTFHAAGSEGSRCVNCHMSDVNWRLLIRRRDHTFQAPVPEMTARFGVPNACTTCHDDRSPEWAAAYMDRWWGDGDRRRAATSLADTMYRAGSADASVLPALVRLAIDRSQSVLVRASAVEFIEQLALGRDATREADAQSQTSYDPGTATLLEGPSRQAPGSAPAATRAVAAGAPLTASQINALIAAAADPEAIVRAAAVRALPATGDRDRVLMPVVARLSDEARVVRARAAEALLALGVVALPGTAGQALGRAQDEFAQAMREFPDDASHHTAIGWLESERDRVAEAHEALDTAIRLDPRAARPVVLKGVLAARAGRYEEAVGLWRKAKSLEPNYPNIDQLISEASKLAGR
jgi:predicted CXXCH cytochrome family protein